MITCEKNRKKIKIPSAAAAFLLCALIAAAALFSGGCAKEDKGNGILLSDLVRDGKRFRVELYETAVCPAQGDYCVAQGAASDGKYAYFVMRQKENGDCIVCKYDMKSGKHVKTSEPIYLFHGNDMTYDSKTNVLYVAHGNKEGKILTAVDPETLSVIRQTVDIEKGAGAITYSAERDRFAISQGGKTLHFLDGELNYINSFDRTDNTGYTAQGMGSDENYIYFPMSSSDSNFIEIYDWEGNYVSHFLLDYPWESESMFCVNGVYYISFNYENAARLYRMEFIPKEVTK